MTSAHLHLAAQNKVHIARRVVVTEENCAVGTDSLRAMSREPRVLFFGQAVELSDRAESSDDLRDGCRLGRWSGHHGLVCLIERLRGKQTFVVAIQSGHLRGAPSAVRRIVSVVYVSIVTGVPGSLVFHYRFCRQTENRLK